MPETECIELDGECEVENEGTPPLPVLQDGIEEVEAFAKQQQEDGTFY